MKVRAGSLALLLGLGCGSADRGENGLGGADFGGSGGDDASHDDDAAGDDEPTDGGAASADAGDDTADSDDDPSPDDGPDSDDAADSAVDDAGSDDASDTGDTGSSDDAASDTGGSDDASSDTGPATDDGGDTGPVGMDACGYPLDGPWLQVEYNQAGTSATSPSWTYSATPGWGESEWASQGESWPEVWDLYQNINVGTDPIGVLATVGPSATWQLMIGLQDLTSYDYATVCVEGRSVSTNASVIFDVYNPLTGCGDSATMSHDWSMHAEGVDLGTCFVEGGGVQAVRIEPSGGSSSLGIKRVRVILHGAVY